MCLPETLKRSVCKMYTIPLYVWPDWKLEVSLRKGTLMTVRARGLGCLGRDIIMACL